MSEEGTRTAKVFELRRNGGPADKPYWHQIDEYEVGEFGRPLSLLNLWLADQDPPPEPGSYRIETSDGRWDETHYAKRAA